MSCAEPEKQCNMLAEKATSLVHEVKHNLTDLMAGWRLLQSDAASLPSGSTYSVDIAAVPTTCQHPPNNTAAQQSCDVVGVSRGDLERLTTETMMLKEFLPKMLSPDILGSLSKLTHREQELWAVRRGREAAEKELALLKRRNESLKSDYEQEKQEKFASKCEVNDLQQQLSQQADYCTSMGAACCTLLWRVSREEESIQSILSGSKVDDFLQLGASTLQSYLDTYSNTDTLPTETLPTDSSLESQFVLALCGTITNVAASAYGRDYLSTHEAGLALVDVFCTALAEAPSGPQCSKLRRLLLMSLYNISINKNGMHYLTSKPDFMRVLTWRLKDESEAANRLHIMRLLQSLIMEPESTGAVHKALEAIPLPLLECLTNDPNMEVREIALELMSDLQTMQMLTLP